ncbi:lipoprotein [Pandoraea sp. SD6-2]
MLNSTLCVIVRMPHHAAIPPMTAPIRTCAIVASITLLSVLAGCGQAGPLYYPAPPVKPAPPPGTPLPPPPLVPEPQRGPSVDVPSAASVPAAKPE